MPRAIKTTLWGILLFLAFANGILAMRYLLPHVPFPSTLPNFRTHRVFLTLHASCAGVALLLGPFQLSERFRLRWRAAHRRVGWVYAAAVALGAIAAFPLALHAAFGPIAASGFFTLDVLWLLVTATALWFAVSRRFAQHRRWMLRSYALTAAAITLRILLPGSVLLGLPIAPSYRAIAWLCWLMNLLLVELYLRVQPPTAPQYST
jgi:uncharacterized membrane protein